MSTLTIIIFALVLAVLFTVIIIAVKKEEKKDIDKLFL
jgi:hypothetical protein